VSICGLDERLFSSVELNPQGSSVCDRWRLLGLQEGVRWDEEAEEGKPRGSFSNMYEKEENLLLETIIRDLPEYTP
jgi:hypothetical protein